MKSFPPRPQTKPANRTGLWLMFAAFTLTLAVYWPGLSGNFLFDDYPNIVENHGVQPQDVSVPSLVRAALSSPSSSFKRPLASLSFAANYLVTGLDPFWMKLTNLIIHLLNGLLVFLLARALLLADGCWGATRIFSKKRTPIATATSPSTLLNREAALTGQHPQESNAAEATPTIAPGIDSKRAAVVAAIIAGGWMLLPINLTGVLYVVQRMESMANLFVLLGLIGYVVGRRHMLAAQETTSSARESAGWKGFWLCGVSITVPTVLGILAKETAVMLPLYALLVEWAVFRSRVHKPLPMSTEDAGRDWRIIALFSLVLVLPMTLGLAWLLPGLLKPSTWAIRDFTMSTRLLSEARIVVDYIAWTLLPTPSALSFYHDDFFISTGLLSPWTTAASIVVLVGLVGLMLWLRNRLPLAALGLALFFGCQLLTGTIIPLELIYEHRNYFASFGLLLAIIPLLAVPRAFPLALPRHALLAGLVLCWTALTALTAYTWGNPLRLAEDLAARAPQSPRAQYELGRTYIIYSHYDPNSPFTALAYGPLERAADLPDASILPEQALIFMNARMHIPLKDAWWDSLTAKLEAHKATVQDESSLGALTQCAREKNCNLPPDRMMAAFMAALSHPNPSARLLATYGDYAWNILDDHALGLRMTKDAVNAQPSEPAYQITLVRMLAAQGEKAEANQTIGQLEAMNIGGQLNVQLTQLRALPGLQ